MGRSKYEYYLIIAGGLLLGNPAIYFLLTGSYLMAFGALAANMLAVALIAWAKDRIQSAALLTFNFLVILAFSVHAEVVFRVAYTEYVIENLYEYRDGYYFNKPNLQKDFLDKEYRVRYLTNGDGLRIAEGMNPEKRVLRADWLFIGDSFTQGAQVEFEELYTSRLYRRFPDKVIVNAGISGLGIAQEYEYYVNEGKNFGAKKVFLQICNFNDFVNVGIPRRTVSDRLMAASDLARYLLYNFNNTSQVELPLGRWVEPFCPSHKENASDNVFYKTISPKKQKDLEEFRRYLKLFAEAARENGAELHVILIPTKEQVKFEWLEEVVHGFKIDIDSLDMQRPNKLMSEWCAALQLPLIDLYIPFSTESSKVFFDFDEHLNVLGHQVLSKAITEKLAITEDSPYLISNGSHGDRYPSLNSLGTQMLFQSFRDGNMEIFVADASDNGPHRLTYNQVDEGHPSWSPDGRYIVLTEGDPSRHSTRIVIMKSDGTARRVITNGPNSYGAIPSFSPDGKRFVYAAWENSSNTGEMGQPYIAVHELGTGQTSALTSTEFEHWRPVYSPDGGSVAYISKRGGQFDVYEKDLRTGKERRLTNTPYDEWDPVYSSDGHLIFAGRKEGNWDLFEIDLQALQAKQLTVTLGDEWDPHATSDGCSILYAGEFGYFNGIYRIPLQR